jgi:hypothetical protein
VVSEQEPDTKHAGDMPALDDRAEKVLHVPAGRAGNQAACHGHDFVDTAFRRSDDIPNNRASEQQERNESEQPIEGDARSHHHEIVLAEPPHKLAHDPPQPSFASPHAILHDVRARVA